MLLTTIVLSLVFVSIFILLHFLLLHIFFLKKNIYILIPFILSNLFCYYFSEQMNLYNSFYNSFIINFSILIIYFEFLLLIKKGFTLSIITSFKLKNKLSVKELIKRYAAGKGAKWILLNRLNSLNKLKIINFKKKIKLTPFGSFLSTIVILLRKILCIRDFG